MLSVIRSFKSFLLTNIIRVKGIEILDTQPVFPQIVFMDANNRLSGNPAFYYNGSFMSLTANSGNNSIVSGNQTGTFTPAFDFVYIDDIGLNWLNLTAPTVISSLTINATSSVLTLSGTEVYNTNSTSVTYRDGFSIIGGTSSGLKILSNTTQKMSVYGVAVVSQQGATIELGTALSNFGVRASGSAYPITTTGAVGTGDLTIGTGSKISKVITATAALNFGSIARNRCADLTITLTGAAKQDAVILGVDDASIASGTNCGDISFFAWVSATDTVTVRCVNDSAVNTADPANGTFRVTIFKH